MMRLASIFSRHADERALLQYLDDEHHLSSTQRTHIAQCEQCRMALDDLRLLQERLHTARAPQPTDGMLQQVLARVDAGETVLLPDHQPMAESDQRSARTAIVSRGRVVMLAVAACAMLAIWLPRTGQEAEAGTTSGELRFIPAAPRPGDSVTVEYRAPVMLRTESRLRLRARFRTEWEDSYNDGIPLRTAATLRRERDGVHRGGFRLPKEVVYGAFAVEDLSAARVDSRGQRLWELLASDSAGRPLPEALDQRAHDLMGRNSEEAFATARERVALTPDDPGARRILRFFESVSLGADADTLLPSHKREWWRLHRLWSARDDVPFAIVNGMRDYVIAIAEPGDSIGPAYRSVWKARYDSVLASAPTDRLGAKQRWGQMMNTSIRVDTDSTHRDSVVAMLSEAERYWNTDAARDSRAPVYGFQIAVRVRDSANAQLRWADRLVQRHPEQAIWRYGILARTPRLRDVARQRLLARLGTLRQRDDRLRPLEFTVAEALRADSAEARETLGALADAELLAGDTVRARATLLRATADGWSVRVFQQAATVFSASGDTRAALPLIAHLVTDPGTPSSTVDSLMRIARAGVADTTWQRMLMQSRLRMRDYFLATAISAPLAAPVPLRAATGETTLSSITANRASVVVFWSRTCAPSRDQMRALDSLSTRLARLDAVLVPVSDEAITPEVQAFLREQKVTVPVYVDHTGTAQRLFEQWAVPEYVVLDARGVIRYRHSTLDLVLAQVAALRAQNDPPLLP